MSNYQISVTNSGAEPHDFLLFAEKPDIKNGGVEVFTAAMAKETIPPNGGTATFEFTHDIYGICGDEALAWGVVITEFDPTPTPIQLGQESTPPVYGSTLKIFIENGVAAFESPEPPPSAGPGSFLVETGSDFPDSSNVYAGIASKSTQGTFTVESAFKVDPSATYDVQPNLIFYVAIGSFKAGQVINITELGVPAQINFLDGTNAASTTYLPNGTYTPPVYSNV